MVDSKKRQVDLLLKNLSANISQVGSSIILERIEKLSGGPHTHPHRKCVHTSHMNCGHQKYGNSAEYLMENSSEKEKGFSR